MPDNLTEFLGLVAAVFTTGSFVPQVVQTWRSRQTRDISLGMFSILVAGNLLWLIYGLILGSLPLIASAGVTFVLASSILYLKLRHG